MTSIGDQLRRERVRRGLTLEKVAADTKIGRHLLEAIEADQFDRLPGGVFARSFVRQYARVLDLDDDELIAALKKQYEQPPDPVSPVAARTPTPSLPRLPPLREVRDRFRSDSSLSAFASLVVVMVVCAGIYKFWQRPQPAAPPKQPAAIAVKPAPRAAEPATPNKPAAVSTPELPKQDFQLAEVTENGTIKVPQPAQTVRPVADESSAGASTFPVAMRVAIRASEPVWVSINTDGAHAYSGTIEGNQSKQFDAARRMTVLVGNAGALEVSLNGKPVAPFGQRGEIRKLELTPAGAHVVPRTPPTPPPTSEDSTAPAAAPEADRP